MIRLPRSFMFVFHFGLALSVVLIVRGDLLTMRHLFWVGSAHVLALFVLGFRLTAPLDRLVVQTLHKTGFLHTLMGLAAAVMAVAVSSGGGKDASYTTGIVLAPMGAALVPHILGVWLGHWVEVQHAAVDTPLEDLKKRLVELSGGAFTLLDEVVGRLKRLNAALVDLSGECVTAGRQTGEALNNLRSTATNTADRAKDLNESVGQVAAATSQIALVHRQLIELMRAPIFHSGRAAGVGR